MVRSSLPVNSPLMMTDFPIFTGPFSIPRAWSLLRAASGAGEVLMLFWGFWPDPAAADPPPGGVGFTASSRFHMAHSLHLSVVDLAGVAGQQVRPVYDRPPAP